MLKNKYDIYQKISPQMLEVVRTIQARQQPPTEDWRQDLSLIHISEPTRPY